MKQRKKINLLKELARWQMLAVVVAILLFIMYRKNFLSSLVGTFIMTNAIALWVHLVELPLKKKYDFSRLTRRGKVAYWAFLIIVGTGFGTFMGVSLIALIFKQAYVPFLKSQFLPILYFCLFVAAVYSVGDIVYSTLKDKIEKKVRENEELKHLQLRTQLMALQAKVNPHFLFNTLNTMLNLVHKYPDKVEAMILNLSDIYRRVLQLPENRYIPLKEELRLVREYLEIEKIRLEDRLHYTVTAAPGLENTRVPPLMIEPIVENAVIHGICPRAEGGTIQIDIREKEGGLEIKIIDNGVGIKNEQRQSRGFGLHSVRERMRLIYKDDARFRINPVPGGGTCVTLELPLEACEEKEAVNEHEN